MADKKISALTGASTPLAGTEVLPIVQSGATVKVAVSDLTAGRAVSSLSLASTTGATFATTSGSVGVGTLSPQAPLHVQTVLATKYAMKVSSAGQGEGAMVFGDGGSTSFNVGLGRWNGSTNASGAGGMGYFSQGTVNGGGHYFYTGDAAAGSTTLRATIDPVAGDLRIATGNIIPVTAAKGINFTANTNAAGMTSNLLNDYEEGTWTPSLSFLSGSVTYTTQAGIYTKVGRLVTVEGYVKIATASSPSTFLLMGNLPFAPAVQYGAASIMVNGMLVLVAGDYVAHPRTAPDIRIFTFLAGNLQNPADNIQAGSEIYITCSYGV
jgi:hypothetical protein